MRGRGPCLGLLVVSTCVLLAGCGWFSGGDLPVVKARPGADRQVPATGVLPPPGPGHAHEQGVATDEMRVAPPRFGSIVAAKGGQKAQREAADKEVADRDAKEREARAAAEREAKAAAKEAPPSPRPPPASSLPGRPAAAEPAREPEAVGAPGT